MKRCSACCRLLPTSAFAINRGHGDGLQSQCRMCIRDKYRTGNDPHRIGRESDPEILARIKARREARPQRLRPPPGPAMRGNSVRWVRKGVGHMVKDAAFVRCCLPSLPDDTRVLGLRHRAVPCGALLFAGDELDHVQDVHGLTTVEPHMFVAVEDREEECA